MTRARRPRRAGRTLAAAALAALIAAPIAAPRAEAAPVQEAPGTTGATPRLRVTAQDLEVAADGDYTVFLDATDAPAGADVVVQIHDRIVDAADLAASSTDEPGDRLATFDPVDLSEAAASPQATGFTIHLYDPAGDRPSDVPANWAFPLDEPGVYPVKVRLRGPDGADLASITTYLVRAPEAGEPAPAPARVALLPTVHLPPPEDEGPATTGTDPVGDDAVDPGYRDDLEALLAAFAERPELPATFVVTPDTAARLDADPDALDTIDDLRTELDRPGRDLAGAPYVDLDPTALVGADLTDELIRQHDLGRRTLTATLEQPSSATGRDTWVLRRPVDAGTVEALAGLGLGHLVLPAEAAPAAAGTRFSLPGTGDVDALTLAPEDLASGSPTDPVLAGNQLLGRLAAAASIDPEGTSVALRIDPRAVDPVELATVLDGLARSSTHLRAGTLAQVFAEAPLDPAPAALTPADRTPLGSYPTLVNRTHQQLTSYASMIPDQPERVAAFEVPLARSASADLDLDDRRSRVRAQSDALGRRLGGVSIPARDRVTLGARNAQFPLPVTSTLTGPVDVVITLEASDRLSFPQDRIEATLTDERTVVQVPVSTRATGDTPLRITVRTPDGGQVLAQSQYTVRSTAVSGVGLLLTLGAAGFLALWWGRHWWRNHRRGPSGPGRHRRQGASTATLADADLDDLFVTDPATDVTGGTGPGSKTD